MLTVGSLFSGIGGFDLEQNHELIVIDGEHVRIVQTWRTEIRGATERTKQQP